MSVLTTLTEARRLIEDPSHWTRGAAARTASDMPVRTSDRKAVSFCAVGTLQKVTGDEDYLSLGAQSREAFFVLQAALNDWDVIGWNDAPYRTHEEVLALFDDAIAYAKVHNL